MQKKFYERLKDYYGDVGKVLRGEAKAAAIFPNPSDIGGARESVYATFLKQHAPSKCNVFLGGFLFSNSGEESKQMDVIVTTDTAPKYNFHNLEGGGKSFANVEGCLAVASIKSYLDKKQLYDALYGLASIPATPPLDGKKNPLLDIKNYEDWPYKIVYASNGLSAVKIGTHLSNFYADHQDIPYSRQPNIIHVAGEYCIMRFKDGMGVNELDGTKAKKSVGSYTTFRSDPDVQAILQVIHNIQSNAVASSHIIFKYSDIINEVGKIINDHANARKKPL